MGKTPSAAENEYFQEDAANGCSHRLSEWVGHQILICCWFILASFIRRVMSLSKRKKCVALLSAELCFLALKWGFEFNSPPFCTARLFYSAVLEPASSQLR